ncbi:MAG: hypothetical protein AAFX87_01180 [Bacteroidota bacterium]
MIGFFEREYLSFKKSHLNNLVALAKSDGHLHEEEIKLLYKLGEKYGLKERQTKRIIESDKKLELHIPNSHENKMNQLYDLVLMVYADGVVDDDEITFCEDIVKQFGYKKELVTEIVTLFDRGNPLPEEWDEFVDRVEANYEI